VKSSRNTFRRNVGTLLLGSGFAQLLAMLALPVLSRLYEPSDFGLLGTYLAIIGIAGTLSLLRYDLAIPLPEKDSEAASVLVLCLFIMLVFTGIISSVLWFFRHELSRLFNSPMLPSILGLVPFGILGWGGFQALSAWASRRGHFAGLARCIGGQSMVQSGAQTALGTGHLNLLGLPIGNLLGQWSACLVLGGFIAKLDRNLFAEIRFSGVWLQAARFYRFPAVSFWSGIVNVLNLYLPFLLFAGFFGEVFAGLYLLGFRVLQMPLNLLGRSVAQVFFPEAVRSHREHNLSATTAELLHFLIAVGLPGILLIGAGAPEFFSLVFGQEWRQAGEMAMWMSPWLALVFVTSPLSNLPFVLERQGQEFSMQLIMLGVRIGALVVGAMVGGENAALGAFVMASFFLRGGYLIWLIQSAGVALPDQWVSIRVPILKALACVGTVFLVRILAPGDIAVLLVLSLLGLTLILSTVQIIRDGNG
jgi:O-antigen/teichoic acid export membrane protein